MKIILNGANGRMGRTITEMVSESDDMEIVFAADVDVVIDGAPRDADVIIDFSQPTALPSLLKFAKDTKIPMVLAATGYSKADIEEINLASKETAILQSATMSIGINILLDLVAQVAKTLQNDFDVEIIEKHHSKKVDAPSGVALSIADTIANAKLQASEYVFSRHTVRKQRSANEIGIHSIRGGTIIGDHSVTFAGTDEIIEISHHAGSRKIFAAGAIRAAKYMNGKVNGLYGMKDVIK